jgi:hypothetical protein
MPHKWMPGDQGAPHQLSILDELFHRAALQAGFLAWIENRLHDSAYVQRMAYEFYEEDLKRKNALNQPEAV